ncbi:MAG: DUF2179 domain-containing protein [Acutalibacteraceae bacterium]
MIVTTKASEITDSLSQHFSSSETVVKATGGYSKKKKEIVYFIINLFRIHKMKTIVHETDPYTFISLHDVSVIIHSAE